MAMRIEEFGGLTCRVSGDADGDSPVVVLLHGFGAPGDDLVPLADWIPTPDGTRYVFPEAPLELGGLYGDSRAWWMIDLASLERGADRAGEVPDGLAPARARVMALLDDVRDQLGVPDERVVLGGLSQGAMLTVDVVLATERAFAGAVLLSGTLLAERVWAPRMAARAGLRVFQSHGRHDGLLPFRGAERLRDQLRGAGWRVDWRPFDGSHEIPAVVLDEVGGFLGEVLDGATVPSPG